MGHTINQLTPTDHFCIKKLRQLGIENCSVLVAVSGGLDSISLLHILKSVSNVLRLKIYVSHIHHGWIHGPQGVYRDKAWKFVKKISESYELPFYSNLVEAHKEKSFIKEPVTPLRSEEELRDFRYECLNAFVSQIQEQRGEKVYLALAHNSSDLLETRLIRIIRGTGFTGLVGMRELSGSKLRPLLEISRNQLESYAKHCRLKWLDDPSNSSEEPLRNWIRNDWLPQLEQKRPGALVSLSRSIRQLSQENSSQTWRPEEVIQEGNINHQSFLELSLNQKQQVLAHYMRLKGFKSYGLSHIKEVLKRLDSEKKEHNFSILKHVWTVNAQQIKARPQEASSH